MTKLYRPEFVYLTQGYYGEIRWHIEEPTRDQMTKEWVSDYMITVSEGIPNPDWEEVIIDIRSFECAADGYSFEHGVLKRTDADGSNVAFKDGRKVIRIDQPIVDSTRHLEAAAYQNAFPRKENQYSKDLSTDEFNI
ncbi:hypothetical protein [Nitrosomonas sp. wSCUT-2]